MKRVPVTTVDPALRRDSAGNSETPYVAKPHGIWVDRLVFPPGLWTWRRRGTPDCLLLVTTGGCGYLRHARGQIEARPGQVLLLMPHATHDFGAGPGAAWEVHWSHFVPTPALAPHLRWPEYASGIRHLTLAASELADVTAALIRGHARLRSGQSLAAELAHTALTEAVLLIDRASPERACTDERVRRAIDHIAGNLQRTLRLHEIARAAGLSVSRLARVFPRQTGLSLRAFIEARRLELARQRLAFSDETVSAISDALGFSSPFYFSRRFRHAAGMSPREYRERARGAAAGQQSRQRR